MGWKRRVSLVDGRYVHEVAHEPYISPRVIRGGTLIRLPLIVLPASLAGNWGKESSTALMIGL